MREREREGRGGGNRGEGEERRGERRSGAILTVNCSATKGTIRVTRRRRWQCLNRSVRPELGNSPRTLDVPFYTFSVMFRMHSSPLSPLPSHIFKHSGRLVDNFLHLLAGAIIALGFVSQEMFIPPIPRQYLPFCPPSISLAFCWYPGMWGEGEL